MDAADHVEALLRHGLEGAVDVVVVNSTPIENEACPVCATPDAIARVEQHRISVVSADLADRQSPLHHDPDRLYEALAAVW
jgi:hypothetical protein